MPGFADHFEERHFRAKNTPHHTVRGRANGVVKATFAEQGVQYWNRFPDTKVCCTINDVQSSLLLAT